MNRPAAKSDTRLGLIAGGGGLPIQAARACVEAGRPLFVVRLKGFADPEMAEYPGMDAGLGEFGKVFQRPQARALRGGLFRRGGEAA